MKFKYICSTLLLLVFLLPACQDYVDGFETDPNNATDAPIGPVMNAALTGLIIGHEGEDARLASMWARQFTGSDRQYSSYNVYNMVAEDFQWDKFYLTIENANIVIEKGSVTNNLLALGIAKIIKAHSMGMLTSLWGDVPYSQANRFPEIQDPLFDNQMDIYSAIQDLLDEAIADLKSNPGNATIESTDFYFQGDPAAWTAVANSLKARFYLHTKSYEQALTVTASGLQDASTDWAIPHTGGGYNQDMNIYHSFGVFDREGYMTAKGAVLPALLDANSDSYRGNSKTDESARFNHIYSGTGPDYDLNYQGMWSPTTSFPLVSAIENVLIEAEAQLTANNDMGAALAALNKAREFLATQYPDGTYEAYVLADFESGGIAAKDGASDKESLMYEIIEEKYASLVGQQEVYNDLRRTNNLMGISPTTGSSIPNRFLIPQVEIDANSNAPNPIPDIFQPTEVFK